MNKTHPQNQGIGMERTAGLSRSFINGQISRAKSHFANAGFLLPPFAHYHLDDWKSHQEEVKEIFDLGLGWDITDFGKGDFKKCGLTLFTIRNGKLGDAQYSKSYAEKIMLVEVHQITPMHFHFHKMEDIINRGGGTLVLQLHCSDNNENLSQEEVAVTIDGHRKFVPAGSSVRLAPGESITLPPRLYHTFWAENIPCIVGEVSMVNDDNNDNRFLEAAGRFPAIIEDVPPTSLTCSDYGNFI